MKVCLILEGCYPYVRGGVSTWAHQYMTASPHIDFVLWTIHATPQDAREMLYDLPANVVEHHQVFLNGGTPGKAHLSRATCIAAVDAMRKILQQQQGGWDALIDTLQDSGGSIDFLTRSAAFLDLARELSEQHPGLGMADAFYGLRSMFLPIARVLSSAVPQADLYHSAVAGYGGLLASLAAHQTGKPMILTEHGLYPREREEELLSADWTKPCMRTLWTQLFYDMSRCAYAHATRVTALFDEARQRQISIGCTADKCVIIPNGIDHQAFSEIPPCVPSEVFHIGAFVRFAAIKDLKTMIHAFAILHSRAPQTVLHLMGGTDDEDYKAACVALIHRLHLEDSVLVEGHVDTRLAMRRMDVTLLSSISEGQPLALLEAMASARACVATRVGNCVELIERAVDGIGAAGICCTPMMPQELADALDTLRKDEALRRRMGDNGRLRVAARYRRETMLKGYHDLYKEVDGCGRHRV